MDQPGAGEQATLQVLRVEAVGPAGDEEPLRPAALVLGRGTVEGEQVLKEGDVVCFPRGKDGTHQIINRSDSPIRVLMLSSMTPGDVIEYLDTGKILAKDAKDDDIMFARPGPAIEYWEDEE